MDKVGSIHSDIIPFSKAEREAMGAKHYRLFVVKVDQDMRPGEVQNMLIEAWDVWNQDDDGFKPLVVSVNGIE